jgi:hypothetical protein
MHIAHHRAASRYASFHRWFGAMVSGLSALVATSIFAAALKGNETDSYAFYIAAFTSLLAAVLAGINMNLNNSAKAEKHFNAAIGFQGLRTEIEEEYIGLINGVQKSDYEHIRNRWTEVLGGTPALPQKLHDKVQEEVEAKIKKEKAALLEVNDA